MAAKSKGEQAWIRFCWFWHPNPSKGFLLGVLRSVSKIKVEIPLLPDPEWTKTYIIEIEHCNFFRKLLMFFFLAKLPPELWVLVALQEAALALTVAIAFWIWQMTTVRWVWMVRPGFFRDALNTQKVKKMKTPPFPQSLKSPAKWLVPFRLSQWINFPLRKNCFWSSWAFFWFWVKFWDCFEMFTLSGWRVGVEISLANPRHRLKIQHWSADRKYCTTVKSSKITKRNSKTFCILVCSNQNYDRYFIRM